VRHEPNRKPVIVHYLKRHRGYSPAWVFIPSTGQEKKAYKERSA